MRKGSHHTASHRPSTRRHVSAAVSWLLYEAACWVKCEIWFVRIEPETADEGHLFTIVRAGTRVKIACDTNKYEEYFWDTIDNLDNHTDIYNGKTEFLAKPEYATLTTYEGKTCIKYTFCLGSKWKWYEINELVDYENGAWKTVEMQADIHDDTITDYMRKKSDNSLQYSYEMSDEELLSLAITEIIRGQLVMCLSE